MRGSGLADQILQNSPRNSLGSGRGSGLGSRRGCGLADQILQNAPDTCEIKIVSEDKEVIDQMIGWSTPSSSSSSSNDDNCKTMQKVYQDQPSYSIWRLCSKFKKGKFMLP